MKKIFFNALFMCIISFSYSQNITISGFVTDSISGEKLIYATIYEKISHRGTTTNNFGYYTLTLQKADSIFISISYAGYKTEIVKIKTVSDLSQNFTLTPISTELQEVTITALNLNDASTGILSLSPKTISLIPSLGGEKDVFKAFQLMPGVMQGTEGKSGLYVRGGSADQNLIILDDVPLYSIDHFTGFFSVFNDDAINSVKLLKGGFPARFGGRLSSVMDVRMKDGNMKKISGSASLGVMTAKFYLEGPIIKDKISFMISARRSMIDLFTMPYFAISSGYFLNYTFYDLNSKINYKISEKDNLYLSFYSGDDNISTSYSNRGQDSKSKNSTDMKSGNFLTAFRWNHVYGNKMFGNFTASFTKYRYFTKGEIKETEDNETVYKLENSISSEIYDLGIKYELEYSVFNFYKICIGADLINHLFKPATIDYSEFKSDPPINSDTTYISQKFNSYETDAYIENQIEISDFFTANLGFRENIYSVNNKKFIFHQPRIILNTIINKNFSVRASYAVINQNIHLMNFSSEGFFSSIWVPATDICSPEIAEHYAFAVETFLFKKYNFETEIFYKKMNNLIEFATGSFWSNAASWEEKSEKNGTGESYGVEIFVNKKYGKITGWVGYTYSKTTRQFENINSGKAYPYEFDRPHDFKIFGNYQFNENMNFSFAWFFQSGRPVNLPIGYYYSVYSDSYDFENNLPIIEDAYTELFTSKNSFRMKPYHRLDVSLNLTKEKKRGIRTWSFSIYNVYNRLNPYYYYFSYDYENGKKVRKLYQHSLFPIIPSVSYSFKF